MKQLCLMALKDQRERLPRPSITALLVTEGLPGTSALDSTRRFHLGLREGSVVRSRHFHPIKCADL